MADRTVSGEGPRVKVLFISTSHIPPIRQSLLHRFRCLLGIEFVRLEFPAPLHEFCDYVTLATIRQTHTSLTAMSRTITVLEFCQDEQSVAHQSNFLFDYLIFREALFQETLPQPKPPRKAHWFVRGIDRIADGVLGLLSLPRFFFRPRLTEKRRYQAMRERDQREAERTSPASLLCWLDDQPGRHIEIDGRGWDLRWLHERITPGPPAIHCEGDVVATLTYLEADCHECGLSYPPTEVRRHYWNYDKGALASGGGRSLCCPHKHLLLKIQDWVS